MFLGLFGRFSCLIGYTPSIPPVPFGLFCLPVATSVCPYAQRARKPFVSKGFRALVSQFILFPLDVVYTETYQKVLVFDDNRNSLYTNYLYYLYYHRFLLSKPAVTIFLTAKS